MSAKTQQAGLKSTEVIVEIGNDWLKLAQVEPSRRGFSVSKLHLEKFDSLDDTVAKSLSEAVSRLKVAKIPVIACLPRQMVNIRMLELPSTDPMEVADMVDLQVGKQTPYSKDEIVSDYRIVGSQREGYSRVMLAIVQRSALRHRFHILEEAGLDVKRMTVSSEGLLNWAAAGVGGGRDGAAAVLDTDSFYSDFAVVADGQLAFTRSILVGANQLLDDPEKWQKKILAEVKRSLEIYQGESGGAGVEKLVVTGAGPNIEGLTESLGGHLGLPAESSDSLAAASRLPGAPDVRAEEYNAVSMTPVMGIAAAPGNLAFDLVPETISLRKGLESKGRLLSAFAVLVVTAAISASLYATLKLSLLDDRLKALESELDRTRLQSLEVERKHDIIKLVRKRQDPAFAAVNVLHEIHQLVPENVLFDAVEMNLDNEQLVLGGTGKLRKDISALIKNLERSALFRNVREGGPTSVDPRTGNYRFQVLCTLESGT